MTKHQASQAADGVDEHCVQLLVLSDLLKDHPASADVRTAIVALYQAQKKLREC